MTKTLNNVNVSPVEKQKKPSKMKNAFMGMALLGAVSLSNGCDYKKPDVTVNLPEDSITITVDEKECEECKECEKEDKVKELMYCPDLSSITVPSYNANYDTVSLGETAILDNRTKIEVIDLTMNNEVILKLKSDYTGNVDRTKTVKLKEGELIEVIDEMGVSMLEVCSVNNGYTLSEKSVLLASDGAVRKVTEEEKEDSTCTLGEKTTESHESAMEDNVQRVYNTWKNVENCEYPVEKVLKQSQTVFDNEVLYGMGKYSISAFSPKLNLGESLELGDGNKLVLEDLKFASEQDPISRAIISIQNVQGEELVAKTVEPGITEIFAGGKKYTIEINEIVAGFTLSEKYISDVKVLNEKGRLRRDVVFVVDENEQYLLGSVGRHMVSFYKEEQYNSNLRLNETMDLGDGNKLKLDDIMTTLYSSPSGIVSIIDKDGNVLVNTVLDKGVDIITVGEKKYKFKTYMVKANNQSNDYYVEVALMGDELQLNVGEHVNKQNIKVRTSIQNTNFGIKGWTFDLEYPFEN